MGLAYLPYKNWVVLGVSVGKYSSPIEHLGFGTHQTNSLQLKYTPPKTAPWNLKMDPLEKEIPIGNLAFSGSMFKLWEVYTPEN